MAGIKTKTTARVKRTSHPSRNHVQISEDEGMTNAPPSQPNGLDYRSDSSERSKDETEKTLEKLVFGDDEGFLQSLKSNSSAKGKELVVTHGSEHHEGTENEGDLGEVDDADLFFLDSGPGTIPPGISAAVDGSQSPNYNSERHRAMWWDSDDDRITVSLASNPRLRKLRDTEAEDVVTGREYIKRLRRQYERLHPRPAWANTTMDRAGNGRKRRSQDADGSGAEYQSDSDMDLDSENELSSLKTQPLSALLRSADSLIDTSATSRSSKFKLRPEMIDIHRLKDITPSSPSAITALSFHPTYPIVLLTAGQASTVFLHHVSPQSLHPNSLLTSLHLKRTALHTVEFRPTISHHIPSSNGNSQYEDATEIFLSSRRRYMHTWQLSTGRINQLTRPIYGDKAARASQRTLESFHLSPCGRYIAFIGSARKGGGVINVLDASTMQWLCACRTDGRGGIADFAWWSHGNGIAVLSKNGEVSEFSIEERRTIARWIDEGNVGPTTLVIGGRSGKKGGSLGPDRWIVTGSTSGIVNIYERTDWGHVPSSIGSNASPDDVSNAFTPRRPSPNRSLDQLTTPISCLTLSSDGQLLVIASRWKKDALRLVHLPSCTVFRNWPTGATPIGRVTSIAVTNWGGNRSGDSGDGKGMWLCVGNEKGKVGMWEIRA